MTPEPMERGQRQTDRSVLPRAASNPPVTPEPVADDRARVVALTEDESRELWQAICPDLLHTIAEGHDVCEAQYEIVKNRTLALAQRAAAMDPAYRDVEVCDCPTPGWKHHTGFHAFVEGREKRAVRDALAQRAAADPRIEDIRALADEWRSKVREYRAEEDACRHRGDPLGRVHNAGAASALDKAQADLRAALGDQP